MSLTSSKVSELSKGMSIYKEFTRITYHCITDDFEVFNINVYVCRTY